MYIPPSQYKTGFHSNNDFSLCSNNSSYTGPYWKMLNGDCYTGESPTYDSIKLKIPKDKITLSIPLGGTEIPPSDTLTIAIMDNRIKTYATNRLIPIPYKPTLLSTNDIKKGSFKRYFVKRNNQYLYMEINSITYNSFTTNSPNIAWDQYSTTSLNWIIRGETENVYNKNKATILEIESINSGRFPKGKNWAGFSQIFKNNYLQFYIPPPTKTTTPTNKSPLSTSGGKYKTSDGKEYIGPYHIHPEKGPMVGAIHTSTPHDYLFPLNRPIPPETPISQQPQELPTQQSSTGGNYSSGGGSFGGGGGGGY